MRLGQHFLDGRGLALQWNFGVPQKERKLLVAQDVGGQPQVLVPLFQLVVFLGQLEDGLGVALPRQAVCHGLLPPCLICALRELPLAGGAQQAG